MLSRIRIASIIAALAFFGLGAFALLVSQEESALAVVYETVVGSPDLGPVEFETLRRRQSPNDALGCPPAVCSQAAADFDPGVYPFPDDELRRRFTAFALDQPKVVPVYRHARPGLPTQDRYVQRTPMLDFPDTIDVRFIALSETTSTLAIYSRSQIGFGDGGVNLARIRLWTGNPSLRGG